MGKDFLLRTVPRPRRDDAPWASRAGPAALLTPVLAGSSSRVRPRLPIHWSSQHLLSDAPRSRSQCTSVARPCNDQIRVWIDTGWGIRDARPSMGWRRPSLGLPRPTRVARTRVAGCGSRALERVGRDCLDRPRQCGRRTARARWWRLLTLVCQRMESRGDRNAISHRDQCRRPEDMSGCHADDWRPPLESGSPKCGRAVRAMRHSSADHARRP